MTSPYVIGPGSDRWRSHPGQDQNVNLSGVRLTAVRRRLRTTSIGAAEALWERQALSRAVPGGVPYLPGRPFPEVPS